MGLSVIASVPKIDDWPRFGCWMLGHDGLSAFLKSVPRIDALIGEVQLCLASTADGNTVPDVDWKRLRGDLGYRAGDYDLRFRQVDASQNDLACRRPMVRCVFYAALAGADAAWAMAPIPGRFADANENAAIESALWNAAEATGWWSADQFGWHPSMPLQPMDYWRPAIAKGRADFAARAESVMSEIAR